MPGPAPKVTRRRRNVPARGEWKSPESPGWQHGPIPEPPDGLREASLSAWQTWFGSWFAANWTPDDIPGLRLIVRMYDEVERGAAVKAADKSSLHTWMRSYGMTPDGQAALRWMRPKAQEEQPSQPQRQRAPSADPYGHLRVVND